jgi:hypothetical protein
MISIRSPGRDVTSVWLGLTMERGRQPAASSVFAHTNHHRLCLLPPKGARPRSNVPPTPIPTADRGQLSRSIAAVLWGPRRSVTATADPTRGRVPPGKWPGTGWRCRREASCRPFPIIRVSLWPSSLSYFLDCSMVPRVSGQPRRRPHSSDLPILSRRRT